MNLLEEINIRIASYGGAERLAHDIEVEWLKSPARFRTKAPEAYADKEIIYLSDVIKKAALKLHRSERSICLKLTNLYLQVQK